MKDFPALSYLRNSERSLLGVDRRGRIGWANPAAGRLFQVKPEDLSGYPLGRWVIDCDGLLENAPHPADTETVLKELSFEPYIRRGKRADGTDVILAIRAIPLGDECSLPLALELETRDGPLAEAVKNQRLVEAIERTPNPVGLADSRGTVLYLNPGFWAFVGLDPRELDPSPHFEDFHPSWALTRIQEEGLPEARAKGVWEGETALLNAAREEVPVLQTVHAHYDPDGSVAFFSTIFRGIAEMRDREVKLQGFYQILDELGAYVFCKDDRLRYTYGNAQVCALLGCSSEEIIGRSDKDMFGESAARMVEDGDKVTLAEGRVIRQEEELYVVSKAEYRTFLAVKSPLRDSHGRVRGLFGVSTDITEQKELEAKLAHQANYDFLTQVLNRSAMEALLERHMKLADRYGRPISLILADVDHFKTINDRLGHEAGDRVLVQLTATLKAHLREADVLARWGGEEFVVAVPETERDEACKLAERLRSAVEKELMNREIPSGAGTLSAGVAQYQAGEPLRPWIRRADQALYEAKETGRNRVSWSD